mmetsp:Transcript_43206/g.57171  ORF Transcript_43206/g.57171 Transcript_43206/m.57171 type:complete len:121 (+) Transcript_43206:819-1181(+)
MRSFYLSDSFLGIKNREVKQLQYKGWPDHGVPSDATKESFSRMLEAFTLMLLSCDVTEKAIVHCSAGIGRTGTTIALAHLITQVFAQRNQSVKDPKVSIVSTVRRIREQRFHLVQMDEQY